MKTGATAVAKTAAWLLVLALLAVVMAGCSAGAGSNGGFTPGGKPTVTLPDEEQTPENERTPPPVLLAEYVGENQQAREDGGRSGLIDMTNVAKGYIAANCNAPVRARMRVLKGGEDSNERDDYLLSNDGTMEFYPLARGDGLYTFVLYIFLEDTPNGPMYEKFLVAQAEVVLESEFAPFLVPNNNVNYDENSECVELSHDITRYCADDLEVVQQIYYWITENVDYDKPKAEQLTSGGVAYVPDPDETLRTKKGICYDYAALAAAMLRANGIPTILVKGDVLSNGNPVYHAWNLIWLEQSGWIAVELAVNPNDWTRIDTTFAAAGPGMASFIGDGTNYTDLSHH